METSPKVWTVGSLLSWATGDFASKKFSDARLAAEVLLAHALKTDRIGLYLRHDEPVSEDARSEFRKSVEERRKGKPVAYITGTKEFYALPFVVDSRVLIPRPETELLVDEVLGWAKAHDKANAKILDVGTGSGAIAVALKKNLPEADVSAVDLSDEALSLASENAQRNEVDVKFWKSDLLASVDEKFDLIVANLPYIARSDSASLSSEVRDFEPHHALFGGPTGAELIDRLVSELKAKQTAKHVMLEMGLGQRETVQKIIEDNGFRVRTVRNDYSGIPRVVCAFV